MDTNPHLVDLGEIDSRGVGERNEDWWNLVFDTNTGELLIFHYWSHMTGLDVTDGEELTPLRNLNRQSGVFRKAVNFLQELTKRKS